MTPDQEKQMRLIQLCSQLDIPKPVFGATIHLGEEGDFTHPRFVWQLKVGKKEFFVLRDDTEYRKQVRTRYRIYHANRTTFPYRPQFEDSVFAALNNLPYEELKTLTKIPA